MNSITTKAAVAAIALGALTGAMLASAQTAMTTGGYCFTQNMKLGTNNPQVKMLQQTLNAKGFTVSATGVGSAGSESSYFGAKTKAAVKLFQSANSVTSTGGVYTLTRAALNVGCDAMMKSGDTMMKSGDTMMKSGDTMMKSGDTMMKSGDAMSGPVSVSLSATQPNTVLATGAARATLANFVFSGNGIVTSVKFMRTGVSNNSTLTNVYLYDMTTGQRLTDSATVLIDNTLTFNNAFGLFDVAGSRNISVLADIACNTISITNTTCNTSGQTVGFSVMGIVTRGNPLAVVTGVSGPQLPIGSVDLATAYFTTPSPASATTLNAGIIGTRVWESALSIGTRAVNFKGITFKFIGSAPIDSLANVRLFVDSVQYGDAMAVSPNSYLTFSGLPRSLTTGSHTFEVRADIVKGSNRNFYLSIENAGDLILEDSNLLGANVSVRALSNTGVIIVNFAAATITINPGSITVAQNTNYTVNTAVGGTSNQVIGSYRFYAYGEDVKVTNLSVTVNQPTTLVPATTILNNLTVYVNGGAVNSGSPITLGSVTSINLGSNLIVPAGSSTIVEVRADLVNSASQNLTAGTIQTTLGVAANGAQGVYSFNLTPTSAISQQGQAISINSGNVVFGKTAGIGNSNISKNQTGIRIASYTLQAGSSEAINITNIALALTGSSTVASNYSNLRVTDGIQTIVPTATNNFSVNYDVASGQTKTIEVWVDTLEATPGLTIIPTATVTFRGRTSNITVNTLGVMGQTSTFAVVTIGTPSIVGASTLGSRYVIGGNTLSSVATFNVTATNGNAQIQDLIFTATTTGTSIIQTIKIGNNTYNNVAGTINAYGVNLTVPSGTIGLNIPVAVTYAEISQANQGGIASGSTDTLFLTGMKVLASGVTTNPTFTATTTEMTVVASLPTVRKTASGQYISNNITNAKVGTITISADPKGDISVSNIPVNIIAPTGGSVSTTTGTLKVRANGTDLISTLGYVAPTSATSGFNFGTTGYRISAGSTITFEIFADISGVTLAGNSDVSLGTAALFSWTDIVNATAISTTGPLTGTLLQSYNTQ